VHKALVALFYIDHKSFAEVEVNQQNNHVAENQFFQLLSEDLFDVETSGLWSKKYRRVMKSIGLILRILGTKVDMK
jgi:hypothetical protein